MQIFDCLEVMLLFADAEEPANAKGHIAEEYVTCCPTPWTECVRKHRNSSMSWPSPSSGSAVWDVWAYRKFPFNGTFL